MMRCLKTGRLAARIRMGAIWGNSASPSVTKTSRYQAAWAAQCHLADAGRFVGSRRAKSLVCAQERGSDRRDGRAVRYPCPINLAVGPYRGFSRLRQRDEFGTLPPRTMSLDNDRNKKERPVNLLPDCRRG